MDSLDVYDALAREDHIEAWVESEAGVAVARLGYDGVLIDGPTDVGEVNASLGAGRLLEAMLADGVDGSTFAALSIRDSFGDVVIRVLEVAGIEVLRAGAVTYSQATLAGFVRSSVWVIACADGVQDDVSLFRCHKFRASLDAPIQTDLFEASLADLTTRPRFVSDGAGNHVLYVAEAGGARIREVVIDPDGDVTATPTSIGTEGGIAVTGLTPTGEIALLIGAAGDGPGDGDLASVRTELVLPRSDGRVVASWEGPLAFPVGILTASDRSFVLVRANTYEPTVSRTHAFRLSQDGRALCLE